ncbi:permease [Alkalibaculum sp. M08DMB]|uniref:Permease n=1 Tax=Alkalibaculum sporogenes TaxID=2655001 RepID=A0A6A7K4Y9_9FIRM|nr:permease [Alkalibaculum sporogenes]MPW24445.1 permease [Alkalibaculum sporogenes]
MNNFILYTLTIFLLLFSYYKNKKKTKMALVKAWKSFENILPEFLGVIMLVGVLLAILNPRVISSFIGNNSGWVGVVIAAIVGSITLIPGFVAFPTAAMILQNGAGIMQIAAFVSSLMMVGVVTLPIEIKYFNKKMAILRNVFGFIFTFIVALIIGKVLNQI